MGPQQGLLGQVLGGRLLRHQPAAEAQQGRAGVLQERRERGSVAPLRPADEGGEAGPPGPAGRCHCPASGCRSHRRPHCRVVAPGAEKVGAPRADLDRTLRLLGCRSVAELDRSYVRIPKAWEAA